MPMISERAQTVADLLGFETWTAVPVLVALARHRVRGPKGGRPSHHACEMIVHRGLDELRARELIEVKVEGRIKYARLRRRAAA